MEAVKKLFKYLRIAFALAGRPALLIIGRIGRRGTLGRKVFFTKVVKFYAFAAFAFAAAEAALLLFSALSRKKAY